MKILVSGGAGYIGSHTVIQLVAAGHDVVIVDNFSNSHPTVLGRLESLTGTRLAVHSFDLCDYDKTEHLFAAEDFDAVIHFAGYKAVGESVEKPLDYYENNLGSTFSLRAGDAEVRRRQAGLLLQRDGLRHRPGRARPRTGAPSRPTPTAGPRSCRSRSCATSPSADAADALRAAALLQPGRRARVRHDRRGPVGHPQQPDALHRPGGGRQARQAPASSATTTTPSTAPACATTSTSRTSPPATSPRSRRSPRPTEPVNVWNLGSGQRHQRPRAARAPSSAPSAASCPTRSSPAAPATSRRPTPTRRKANAELGWSTKKSVDDMCADTWRWQSQNPQGYAG